MSGATLILLTCMLLLLWCWFGYPLLMLGIARFFPRRLAPKPDSLPVVSVIVATRDDVDSLAARIDDLLASSYPSDRLEVVVCVDHKVSMEQRVQLHARAAGCVLVVDGDAPGGKAASLNAGVRHASGRVVVFTDVQQRFEPTAITALVETLTADPRATIAGGALMLPGDRAGSRRSPVEWYWAAERVLREAEARVHSTIGVSGSIYAMRADAWIPMPPGLILDDVYVPMQQVLRGRRVAYTINARAWDTRRTGPNAEQTRKVRTLTGNFQLVVWLPILLVPFRNPVWLQFISHKMLRLATPWLALGALLSVGTIGYANLRSAPPAVLVGGALIALVPFLVPPSRPPLRGLLRWVVSLNSALVQASINGVRGHWDVW